MHTVSFLAPGHFHAALTLRERHPLVRDDIVVYADEDAEIGEFLELVAAFNARAERPTRWRPDVRVGAKPLDRLCADRPGDVVILAGRNDVKMGWIRRLHDAGFSVLADKPWMTESTALADLRQALSGPPLAMELLTGRHETTTLVERMLVGAPDVFGTFAMNGDEAAITFESVHHLEKHVNGAPLRRPPWFFDVRVQGDGLADIPTHLVDHAQQLVGATAGRHGNGGAEARTGSALQVVAARRWATRVPRELFSRVTGVPDFPVSLGSFVDGDRLEYPGNAELVFRCGTILVSASTRWDLTAQPGGGDLHRAHLRGTRADVHVEQSADTGWRRRLVVKPRPGTRDVDEALRACVASWQSRLPGLDAARVEGGWELVIPPALRSTHEAHFPLVLGEFLGYIERGEWPKTRMADTLAKYELLAEARQATERSRSR
jgi:predicted dehydrogenase